METTHSTPATTGRLRRRLVGPLLALIIVLVGSIVGTAQPAHADSFMYACFQRLGLKLPVLEVQVQVWRPNQWPQWNTVTKMTTNMSGCLLVNLPAPWNNEYLRFYVLTSLANPSAVGGYTILSSAGQDAAIPFTRPGNGWSLWPIHQVNCTFACGGIGY